jgi:hypothetical protein
MPDSFSSTPAGDPVTPCAQPTHWIEIVLTDENDKPVAGETYKVTLPNGDETTGYLDANGAARIDGIVTAGMCKVSFPGIDGNDWSFVTSS